MSGFLRIETLSDHRIKAMIWRMDSAAEMCAHAGREKDAEACRRRAQEYRDELARRRVGERVQR